MAEGTDERRERKRLEQARWRAKNPGHAAALRRSTVRRWRERNPEKALQQTREAGARHREKRRGGDVPWPWGGR